MATETHELIPRRKALKILTWVSDGGLTAGAMRTNELTRFPCGNRILFSRQECEALRDSIINTANPPKRRFRRETRPTVTELV